MLRKVSEKDINKMTKSVKRHSVNLVRSFQRYILPFLIVKEHINYYGDNGLQYAEGGKNKYNKLYCTDQYHYKDKWYSFKYSNIYPEESIGIIKVEDMPYRSFSNKVDKESFISRLDSMVLGGYVEPFALFVDGEFVNWYDIDIVFDVGHTYLLLHGEKYNYYSLKNKELAIIVLPFGVDYIGIEPDTMFDMNLNILKEYLEDTLYLGSDNKYHVIVPTINTEYEYHDYMYSVGGWLYTQNKLFKTDKLSQDKIDKLKNIILYYKEYDMYGNETFSYPTRFNALDIDVYDPDVVNDILLYPKEYYENNALFRFNSDGILDDNGDNIIVLKDESVKYKRTVSNEEFDADFVDCEQNIYKENVFQFIDGKFTYKSLIDVMMYNTYAFRTPTGSTSTVYAFYNIKSYRVYRLANKYENLGEIFVQDLKKAYLDNPSTYKNSPIDSNIVTHVESVAKFDNVNIIADPYVSEYQQSNILMTLNRGDEIRVGNYLYNRNYRNVLYPIKGYIYRGYVEDKLKFRYSDLESKTLLGYADGIYDYYYYQYQYDMYDKEYRDEKDFDQIAKFDPSLTNEAIHKRVYSTILSGTKCNEELYKPMFGNNKIGLKIPRMRHSDHESYVLIYLNGELIDNYSDMVVYTNYHFLPRSQEFNDDDIIELVFYTYVDNNEIEFKVENTVDEKIIQVDDLVSDINIFSKYIKPKDLKIFTKYPSNIMQYPTLVKSADEAISFNISYKDDELNTYVYNDAINTTDTYVAVSDCRFAYQRLYTDKKTYRLLLDKRFKYCDDLSHYELYINGRRMDDNTFLVTIPKFTRPFWGMYLYTATFVDVNDRIELFYLPFSSVDVTDEDSLIGEKGYIHADINNMTVPLDKDLYGVYVNGRRITPNNIRMATTHTLRILNDAKSQAHGAIVTQFNEYIPSLKSYMVKNNGAYINKISSFVYDFIDFFGTSQPYGYENIYGYLDLLMGSNIKMSNIDPTLYPNVQKIAIVNEIVRDFWVTSGYPYSAEQFIYDYELDERHYVTQIKDGVRILPSMDGRPEINIKKNDIHVISLVANGYTFYGSGNLVYEIGSTITEIELEWAYSEPLTNIPKVLHQYVNKIEIDKDLRKYVLGCALIKDSKIPLTFNTTDQILTIYLNVLFRNPIYYGAIDEDVLQYYNASNNLDPYINDIVAISPKSGIPSSPSLDEKMSDRGMTLYDLSKQNNIIRDVEIDNHIGLYPSNNTNNDHVDRIGSEHRVVYEILNSSELGMLIDGVPYIGENDVIIEPDENSPRLNKLLTKDVSNIELNNYIVGDNKYFVVMIPTEMVFSNDGENIIKFQLPDVNDFELVKSRWDEHTDPVYTSGNFTDENKLEELDAMRMINLGTFKYTNEYGYTIEYNVWRSNGFYTRRYSDVAFNYRIYTD